MATLLLQSHDLSRRPNTHTLSLYKKTHLNVATPLHYVANGHIVKYQWYNINTLLYNHSLVPKDLDKQFTVLKKRNNKFV